MGRTSLYGAFSGFSTRLCFAAALAAFAATGASAASDTFRPFLGSWQGTGAITSSNGQREPLSCRAAYDGDDSTLNQSLVCASDSFRLNIQSNISSSGGAVQGTWQETTRSVQGQLSGELRGGDFEGNVSGPGFTAQISLRAAGRRQVVHIQPSAGDVQSVDITLTKRR